MSVLVHRGGGDLQDDWLAATCADFVCGGFVGGEVNVVAGALLKSLRTYAVDECCDGTVIKRIGQRLPF